jgi:predicted dehydrogenase
MRIRVGVIGGGIWGNYHLLAIRNLQNDGKAQLVAIATRTEASAKKHEDAFGIKGYTDYKRMIDEEDLDAVTVVTPDHLHLEMTLYALERGKHVLVEKPMALKAAECATMVDLAAKKNALLQVDFHKRYDPYNIDAMRKVREGKLGDPYYAYAYMEDKIVVPWKMLANWASRSSPFWFIGVHKFDLVRWITGREAVLVFSQGRKGKLSSMGIDTFDAVSTSIQMEGGLACTIDVNWILPMQFEAFVNQGLRLVGSEGIIELDSQDRGLRYCLAADGMITPNPGAFFSEESMFGQQVRGYFVDAIKDFVHNILFLKSGGSLKQLEGRYPSGKDGLRATQVAEAVEESIHTGRQVKIPEFDREK